MSTNAYSGEPEDICRFVEGIVQGNLHPDTVDLYTAIRAYLRLNPGDLTDARYRNDLRSNQEYVVDFIEKIGFHESSDNWEKFVVASILFEHTHEMEANSKRILELKDKWSTSPGIDLRIREGIGINPEFFYQQALLANGIVVEELRDAIEIESILKLRIEKLTDLAKTVNTKQYLDQHIKTLKVSLSEQVREVEKLDSLLEAEKNPEEIELIKSLKSIHQRHIAALTEKIKSAHDNPANFQQSASLAFSAQLSELKDQLTTQKGIVDYLSNGNTDVCSRLRSQMTTQ